MDDEEEREGEIDLLGGNISGSGLEGDVEMGREGFEKEAIASIYSLQRFNFSQHFFFFGRHSLGPDC